MYTTFQLNSFYNLSQIPKIAHDNRLPSSYQNTHQPFQVHHSYFKLITVIYMNPLNIKCSYTPCEH